MADEAIRQIVAGWTDPERPMTSMETGVMLAAAANLAREVLELRAERDTWAYRRAEIWEALGGKLPDETNTLQSCRRVAAELAQARADLAAAQDRLTWPRWVHRRAEGTTELWLPSYELLAVVWGADGEQPAGWRAWHAPLGSGPPCPWEQGAGGIDEAEAYLVAHGRIRPGCTIRPAVIDAARKGGEGE